MKTLNLLFKFLHLLIELAAMFLATVLLFYFEMDCEGRKAAEQIDRPTGIGRQTHGKAGRQGDR